MKLLDVDLVILNEHGATYAQDLQESLESLVRTSQSNLAQESTPGRGGVHLLRGDRLTAEDRDPAPGRGPGGAARVAGAASPTRSPAWSTRTEPHRMSRHRPRRARQPPRRDPAAEPAGPRRTSSSSTGSAASPRAGGST